jgi:hypothetical protein
MISGELAAAPPPPEENLRPAAAALEELEFHWGSAYDVAIVDGMWTARRKDGRGGTLVDLLPEGLRLRIQADYAAMPVPRDLP